MICMGRGTPCRFANVEKPVLDVTYIEGASAIQRGLHAEQQLWLSYGWRNK